MLLGKVSFIAVMILMIIIRYPYRNRLTQNPQDRQEQILLTLISIGGLVIPLIYIFSNWLAFADYVPSLWVVGLGIIVMAAALWLFWRSHADLGRNWSASLELHAVHKLITQGVYQRVRHPMYGAMWLIGIAQVLLLSNWVAGFSGIVCYGLLYFLRVPREEDMMLKEFGEQYQQYMSKTGRIFPKGGLSQ